MSARSVPDIRKGQHRKTQARGSGSAVRSFEGRPCVDLEPLRRLISPAMTIAREFLPLDGLGRRRLKLAFVGTHGVGKTTLCYDLAAQLKRLDLGVDLVKEVARRCPLPINEETTVDAQAWILHTQIAEEIAAGAMYEVVICDRSVLDNYAYLVTRIGRRPDLDPLVDTWIRSYDALFKVPVLDAPSFDGTRAVSRSFQMEIDGTIDELVRDFGVSVLPLDPSDRDGWIPEVMQTLGLPQRPPQIDLFTVGVAGASRVAPDWYVTRSYREPTSQKMNAEIPHCKP